MLECKNVKIYISNKRKKIEHQKRFFETTQKVLDEILQYTKKIDQQDIYCLRFQILP